MTKKDYEMVAGRIAKLTLLPIPAKRELVVEFCDMFKRNNPRFNPRIFYNACYPKAETEG